MDESALLLHMQAINEGGDNPASPSVKDSAGHYNEATAPTESDISVNQRGITADKSNFFKMERSSIVGSNEGSSFTAKGNINVSTSANKICENMVSAKQFEQKSCSMNYPDFSRKQSVYSLLHQWYKVIVGYILQSSSDSTVHRLIYWEEPIHSGLVLFSILFLIIALKYWSALAVLSLCILTTILLTGLYKLVGILTVSIFGYTLPAFPSVISKEWQINQSSNDQVMHIIDFSNNLLKWLQHILLWNEVIPSILVIGFLFLSFNVGRCFDTLTILFIKILCLFTIPYLYTQNKHIIQSSLDNVNAHIEKTKNNLLVKLPYFGQNFTQIKKSEKKD